VRILIVEDDPLIREFVVEALREEGYEVIHAANGEEALAWCGKRVAGLPSDFPRAGKSTSVPLRSQVARGKLHDHQRFLTPRP